MIFVVLNVFIFACNGLDMKFTYNSNGLLDKIAYEDLSFTDATRVDMPTVFSSKKFKKNRRGGDEIYEELLDGNGHVLHEEQVSYKITYQNKEYILDLVKNEDLFAENYITKVYDGDVLVSSEYGQEHCYYLGTIRGFADSMVVVSTCAGLHGRFRISHEMEEVIIEPAHIHFLDYSYSKPKMRRSASTKQILFTASQLIRNGKYSQRTCGVVEVAGTNNASNSNLLENIHSKTPFNPHSFRRRNIRPKYLELAVAQDSSEYNQYKGSPASALNVQARSAQIVNDVMARYRDTDGGFDTPIAYVLVEQRTFLSDPFTVVADATTLLANWCSYRQTNYSNNDATSLLSYVDFTGSTVGLAYVGTICTPQACSIVQDNALPGPNPISDTGAIMAHETGHNWSFQHDGSQSCSIMAACSCGQELTTCKSVGLNHWSNASRDAMATFLPTLSCVDNVPAGGPACPNNIIDAGEVCDDGPSGSMCCTSSCQLQPTMQCSYRMGNQSNGYLDIKPYVMTPCCSSGCQMKTTTTLCQAAVGECGQDIYCDGLSTDGKCPTQPQGGFTNNGSPCSNNGMCWKGQCVSVFAQCFDYWGSTFPSITECLPNPTPQGCTGTLHCNDGSGCFSTIGAFNEPGSPCRVVSTTTQDGQCYNNTCILIGECVDAFDEFGYNPLGAYSTNNSIISLTCVGSFNMVGSPTTKCINGAWAAVFGGSCLIAPPPPCLADFVSNCYISGGAGTNATDVLILSCANGCVQSGTPQTTCLGPNWSAIISGGTCTTSASHSYSKSHESKSHSISHYSHSHHSHSASHYSKSHQSNSQSHESKSQSLSQIHTNKNKNNSGLLGILSGISIIYIIIGIVLCILFCFFINHRRNRVKNNQPNTHPVSINSAEAGTGVGFTPERFYICYLL